MSQVILDAAWRSCFLCQFNIPPYQAPHHPWYWPARFVLIALAIRAFFWVLKQLPKENKSLRKTVRPPPATPYTPLPTAPTASEPAFARDILVLKDGQQLGPYPVEEINRQLFARSFKASDLAWHEGLAEWQPLGSIAGVVSSHAPHMHPPAPPAPATSWSSLSTDELSAPSSGGLLHGGYLCAAVSLMFLPPVLGLAGIVCGVVVIKRGQATQGTILLVVSFVCAVVGMMIGAASQ